MSQDARADVDLLLEEYRTLRAEILSSLTAQHQALSYGTAGVALLVAALATIWQESPTLAALGFMIAVPIAIYFVLFVWCTEVMRMRRAGSYLARYLEPRVDIVVRTNHALQWERWLERGGVSRSLRGGVGLAGLILWILAISSFTFGTYRFDATTTRHWNHPHTPGEGTSWLEALFLDAWVFWISVGMLVVIPTSILSMMTRRNTRPYRDEEFPDPNEPLRRSIESLSSTSPFRSWNGVEPHALFPGVGLRAIAGEQVFLGHVTYAPGTVVARHSHPQSEQVMWIVEGSLRMTVGDETAELGPGGVVVVSRGIEHELVSEGGVTFVEAMSPVPRDHIPDPARDLVLGQQGDSLHVDR